MVDSSATGDASAIFTSLEEIEVLPLCEMKMLFWPLSFCLKKDLWLYSEEVDLEELQFLPSLNLYLIKLKQKAYLWGCPFINKTVDQPCIASRCASISCRGSEDEIDVVEYQED